MATAGFKALVIVESPAKATKIASFLGSGYVGLTVDYDTNGLFLMGAEAGWKVSF